jgi:hypothetical protein
MASKAKAQTTTTSKGFYVVDYQSDINEFVARSAGPIGPNTVLDLEGNFEWATFQADLLNMLVPASKRKLFTRCYQLKLREVN